MGRRAGVTTDETRTTILKAAAKVFARRGYEGASIAEITKVAGLSSGPIYGHFGSKAELFVATLEAHTDRELDRILGGGASKSDLPSVLSTMGNALSRPPGSRRSLLVEAAAAAHRDPAVAKLLSEIFAKRQSALADLIEVGKASGEIDPRVDAAAVARFSVIITLGSHLINSVDGGPSDPESWRRTIAGVVNGLRPR